MFRLITFRLTPKEFYQFNSDHLIVGLVLTLLVGIGRTYHNTRAEWWQNLGLGSVAYIIMLATLLWLILWPLGAHKLSWKHILTFLALVSPTGVIYAIPVDEFLTFQQTSVARAWFLGIVALWRVALWVYYLRFHCRLRFFSIFVACLFPLCFIVTALTIFNVDKVVFDFMRGVGETTVNDQAYMFLVMLTTIAIVSFVPLLICYLIAICIRNPDPDWTEINR